MAIRMVAAIVLQIVAGIALLNLCACAPGNGGRVYLGYEAVDEIQRTEKTNVNRPWKCLWENCDEVHNAKS